jgi:hypothetical protein
MKKSTIIIGVSTLVFLAVGTYLYLKGKKKTTPTDSSPTSTTSINETSSSASIKNTSTKNTSAEEEKNYLEAKDLARILLLNNSRVFDNEFKLLITKYAVRWNPLISKTSAFTKIPIKRINALGYKVLPNYDIEKM